ncbi:MAG: chromate transporter [Clostridia bacterium]|nr:chromate transporter [Clostridia bacterium]
MKELLTLFLTFAKIGATTFGGGYAMLPMFQRELADKRGWITEEEIFDYYAISACTPGVIAVNVATLTGYKLRGVLGALFATLGVISPSIVIITLVAALLAGFAGNEYVIHALAGVRVAVCALVAVYIAKMIKKGVRDLITLGIFAAALAIAVFLPVSPVYIVAGAAVLGIVLSFILPMKKEEKEE